LPSVVLIGLPGSGKTTVGRQLARRLRIPFVDSDHVIEQRLGLSISEYFAQAGEEKFRDFEQTVIEDLTSSATPQVLSTGGGAILRSENRIFMRDRGQVVYLRSFPEEIYRRLKNDTSRPLLQVDDPLAKLRELFEARDPLYRETAHFIMETGRPSVATTVNMIVMQLELTGWSS
jgi:shikimate kinase